MKSIVVCRILLQVQDEKIMSIWGGTSNIVDVDKISRNNSGASPRKKNKEMTVIRRVLRRRRC